MYICVYIYISCVHHPHCLEVTTVTASGHHSPLFPPL